MPTTTSVFDNGKIDDILNSLEKAYKYTRDNSEVLSKLDGAKQIIDAVGEVGSIARSPACFHT